MLPRGFRNNNPLNIRRSKDQWKGLAEAQTDRAFVQFKSLEYGWRAAFQDTEIIVSKDKVASVKRWLDS